jgi:cardiolipin synthase
VCFDSVYLPNTNRNQEEETMESQKKILTIPNILTLLRILLIPVITWLYCFRKEYIWALNVLVLSAATDLADGYIARTFHMISDFGKILDPIADKLTQAATLVCLVTRFPIMWLLFAAMVLKESTAFCMSYYAVRKSGFVMCADWHGKLTTVLLYTTMALHIIWVNIPYSMTVACVCLCLCAMLLSAVLYAIRNFRQAKGKLNPRKQEP